MLDFVNIILLILFIHFLQGYKNKILLLQVENFNFK